MTASKIGSCKALFSLALLATPLVLAAASGAFAQGANSSMSSPALGSSSTVGAASGGFEARTLIKASRRVSYRTEIAAPVLSASYQLGQTFKEGERLLELDCRKFDAERKAAEASARAADIELDTKQRLHKYNAVGKNEVDLAAANADQAAAQAEVHAVQTDFCAFTAPFDGRVVELNVRPFEYPPSDQPLIVVIDDTELEMEVVVPSNWLSWLKPGQEFDVEIEDIGIKTRGIVRQIGAEVDPVSRTVRVVAAFPEQPQAVLAGMSGNVLFDNNVTN